MCVCVCVYYVLCEGVIIKSHNKHYVHVHNYSHICQTSLMHHVEGYCKHPKIQLEEY